MDTVENSAAGTFEPLAKVSDKRGLALFEEVIDEIEARGGKTWNQETWFGRTVVADDDNPMGIALAQFSPVAQETLVPEFDCGTVACLFGHTAFKAGGKLAVFGRGKFVADNLVMTPDGVECSILAYATEVLELPADLASYVSSASRTWPEILAFRDAWRLDAPQGWHVDANRMRLLYSESCAACAGNLHFCYACDRTVDHNHDCFDWED